MKRDERLAQLTEAIVTHPEETITVADIIKEAPDIPMRFIQAEMRGFVDRGILEAGVRLKYQAPKTYRIKVRQIVPSPAAAKARREVVSAKAQMDLSSAETGRSIILAYQDLQAENNALRLKIEDMHSSINKEKSAAKVGVAERDKTIADLKEKLTLVRAKVKELEYKEDNDLRFPLGNTPRLKALNGRKM